MIGLEANVMIKILFLLLLGFFSLSSLTEEYVDEEDIIEEKDRESLGPGPVDEGDLAKKRAQQREKQLQKWMKQLESLKRKGRERDLLNVVSKILNQEPNNIQALNALGAFYLQSGKIPLAKIIFTRALNHHPKNSSLQGNLAVIALKEGKKEKAIAGFQKSLRYRYNNYSSAGNLGTLYLQAYEHSLALEPLELAYSRAKRYLSLSHPKVLKIGNNYAVALARSGYFRKSEEIFRELVKKNPGSVSLLLNYAILLGKDLKEKKKARQFARKAELMDKSGHYKRKIEPLFRLFR